MLIDQLRYAWHKLLGQGARVLAEGAMSPRVVRNYLWRVCAQTEVEARWRQKPTARRHELKSELIVSLTSYAPRFDKLPWTLRCLLTQSVTPDRTILWIAERELSLLPKEIWNLEDDGLTINACDELRSYKKIVPVLERYPDAFVVTADDDLYYPRTWLADLVSAYRENSRTIPCHRAHRLVRGEDGRALPYTAWKHNIEKSEGAEEDVVPTSGAGMLLPPKALPAEALDKAAFERLCPTSDDLWIYWHARRCGWVAEKIGPPFRLVEWSPGGQSLWALNSLGENDRALARLERDYPLVADALSCEREFEWPG